MPEPFALYVHVPWCRRVCPYCDFNVYADRQPPEAEYTTALVAELGAWATRAPWEGRRVASVFVGGGTPSLFSPEAIGRVLAAAAGGFGLTADAEITLEANPGTVTDTTLRAYRAAGVNRLSLGVQSFAPRLLARLGRDHTPADAEAAVAAARAAGLDNVSVDLIFAVPGSTRADWAYDLDRAIALDPAHISTYALTFEEGTPYHAWRRSGRVQAVDEDDEVAMAEHAATRLPAAGYERYEISSWARPERASAHNQRYWTGVHYLGIGAGAHSFDAGPAGAARWSNLRHPRAYIEAVAAGATAVAETRPLDVAELRSDFVFTGLRRLAGIDAARFADRFGLELTDAFPQIPALVRDGLLEWGDGHLRLSPHGLRFADTVAASFV